MLKLWKLGTTSNSVSQEVKEFIALSRRCQTLYALFEGYQNRIFRVNDEDLVEYLRGTLYYDSCSEDYNNLSANNTVNIFMNKILCLETAYLAKEEINLTVIWTFLYTYDKRVVESTPVLKIFLSESSVIFIDSKGDSYHSWEQYLDTKNLPNAFICVPQDGTYSEENGRLILNYFRSIPDVPNDLPVQMFTPYSWRRILGLFTEENKKKFLRYMSLIPEYAETYILPLLTFIYKCYVLQYDSIEPQLEQKDMDYKNSKMDIIMLGIRFCMTACESDVEFPFITAWKTFIQTCTAYFNNTINISFKDVAKQFMELISAVKPILVLIMNLILPSCTWLLQFFMDVLTFLVDSELFNSKNKPTDQYNCSGDMQKNSVPRKNIDKLMIDDKVGHVCVVSKEAFPQAFSKYIGNDFQLILEDDGNYCVMNSTNKEIGYIIRSTDVYMGHFESDAIINYSNVNI